MDEGDFLDRLYAVAMEPERFSELVAIWQQRLSAASERSHPAIVHDVGHFEEHLNRAETLLSLVTENEDSLPTPLIEKLNSESQAMAAIASDGQIQAQNDASARLYGTFERRGYRDLPFAKEALEKIGAELALLDRDDRPDVSRRLVPTHRIESDLPVILSFAHWTTPGGRRLLLVKSVDFAWPDHLTPLVIDAFELTKAEAGVMKMLAEGASPQEIADRRGAAIATVRSQIRAIYGKTATRNQSEFMRMAIGLTTLELADRAQLAGAFPATPRSAEPPFPRPDQRAALTLPDGRLLDYAQFGASDGDPCLYFHSEYFGDVWPADLVREAAAANLRIIAPARPAYGRSTPLPRKANAYDQAPEDLAALLDHLGVARVVNVTQAVGGVFSAAFASARPDRVAGIVSVAPMFPVITAEDEANMPKFARFMSSIVSRHPRMLEFVARLGLTYHNRVGSKRFLSTIFQDTPVDLAIVEDPENLEAIVQGFQLCASHGYAGYLHDFRHLPTDRKQRWIDMEAPHIALLGDSDNNTREQRCDRLIEAGANIEKRYAEGGSQLLFFSHPGLVAGAVREIWNRAHSA